MLSFEEYESLKFFRADIFNWKATGKFNGNGMQVIDVIRQKHGYRPMNYGCDGCKLEALTDAYNFIVEYEQTVR